MIKIKPAFELDIACPECGDMELVISKVSAPGIHWLADCICGKCGLTFLQTLPAGHTVDYNAAFGKANKKIYPEDVVVWQTEPFQMFCENIKSDPVTIRKVVSKEHKRVIILNALDFLYGHTLLKLYNSQYHLDTTPEFGLIVIIPRIFEWMIPKGCAEAWIVDLKLSELAYGYDAIDRFVENELARFEEIYLSRAYSHPDYTQIDIERLTGVRPFNVDEFYQNKPVFTFALREDRLWYRDRLSGFLFRPLRVLNLLKFLVKSQDALVKRTIRHIRRAVPEAEFYITGLGKSGSLSGSASDKRSLKINTEIEREWCRIYAKSHVIIGIHGSNMLIPTALAAGCVEILPESRTRNMIQDISVRYSDRRQLFFYRFADQFSSPRSIAHKAVSIVKNYENCFANMVRNFYR